MSKKYKEKKYNGLTIGVIVYSIAFVLITLLKIVGIILMSWLSLVLFVLLLPFVIVLLVIGLIIYL